VGGATGTLKRYVISQMSYEDALTFADDDIDDNWEVYRERFLKGDIHESI